LEGAQSTVVEVPLAINDSGFPFKTAIVLRLWMSAHEHKESGDAHLVGVKYPSKEITSFGLQTLVVYSRVKQGLLAPVRIGEEFNT